MDLILGWGRSPEIGHGYMLHYSFLENSMDREAWQATTYGVPKSWTWLATRILTHTHYSCYLSDFSNKRSKISLKLNIMLITLLFQNFLSWGLSGSRLSLSASNSLSWGRPENPFQTFTFKPPECGTRGELLLTLTPQIFKLGTPEDPCLTLSLKPRIGGRLGNACRTLTFKLLELKAPGGSSC